MELRELVVKNDTKIVLLVIDGIGGLPHPDTGLTELETANTPVMDELAAQCECGMSYPIAPGITPGSGPAHLGLFGYDPIKSNIGRGVLAAMGIGLDLEPGDVACRVNFATMKDGVIIDRRAGRIANETTLRLCNKLGKIKMDGVEVIATPVKEHRASLIFRGEGLNAKLSDSDPQKVGLAPLAVKPLLDKAAKTANIVNSYIKEAIEVLKGEYPANAILTRGFDSLPDLPGFEEKYMLKAAGIAAYPMYRGLARLAGMDVVDTGESLEDEIKCFEDSYNDYDFFFIHIKPADSFGEDGDFAGKIKVLESVDRLIPRIKALSPDVLVITGDHSTPATYENHSWHPVPVMLNSKWTRNNNWIDSFSEKDCTNGSLGFLKSKEIMSLALAHGMRLNKFGA